MDALAQQVQAMQRRMSELYQQASYTQPSELLPKAFEELQYALEQLRSAEDILRDQRQELEAVRDACEQERQHTIDAFNGVPVAYLITRCDGTIRRVNQAATLFLNQPEKFLLGKSLGLFIPEGERRAFRAELPELEKLAQPEERVMRLQPQGSRPLDVCMTVGAGRDRAGRVVALHWLLRHAQSRRGSSRKLEYAHM